MSERTQLNVIPASQTLVGVVPGDNEYVKLFTVSLSGSGGAANAQIYANGVLKADLRAPSGDTVSMKFKGAVLHNATCSTSANAELTVEYQTVPKFKGNVNMLDGGATT